MDEISQLRSFRANVADPSAAVVDAARTEMWKGAVEGGRLRRRRRAVALATAGACLALTGL